MHLRLKNIPTFTLLAMCCLLSACDRMYTNYVQDNGAYAEGIKANFDIVKYVALVDSNLKRCKTDKSLIYSMNDCSFHVVKYSLNGHPVLYKRQDLDKSKGLLETRFYLIDDKVVSVVEGRSAIGQQLVSNVTNLDSFAPAGPKHDYSGYISYLEDALQQRNDFDLVFEGITSSPQAKYLILSRDRANTFRAPLKIENDDEFIRELASNPMQYKGSKLDIKWSLGKNSEAVYENGSLKHGND